MAEKADQAVTGSCVPSQRHTQRVVCTRKGSDMSDSVPKTASCKTRGRGGRHTVLGTPACQPCNFEVRSMPAATTLSCPVHPLGRGCPRHQRPDQSSWGSAGVLGVPSSEQSRQRKVKRYKTSTERWTWRGGLAITQVVGVI